MSPWSSPSGGRSLSRTADGRRIQPGPRRAPGTGATVHRSQQARAGRALTTGWGEDAQDPDAPGPAFQLTATGGTSATTAAPDGTGSEDRSPGRRHPHRPGRGVAAEIALLLVLFLALPPLLLGGTPAETVARRFLQALVDGDMATIQEHLTPPGDALDLASCPPWSRRRTPASWASPCCPPASRTAAPRSAPACAWARAGLVHGTDAQSGVSWG